ncbi:Clavaminate synthase-like protein [Polychaeton citri CBS 116435]|uniref:Clavaminate synthase-like protein n=1 Tax=Polychaeton citri CBS 116435 TaxID=1314669 RepID=A0A9P4QEL3_9PEZI|nr:Clavaminate synthase-like protein [Polychaeton citri CBS 116435]
MTLPVPSTEEPISCIAIADHDARPAKKQKTKGDSQTPCQRPNDGSYVRRHPLGVRPSGNALTASRNLKTACGLFALLPDELLMNLLEIMDARVLLLLGGTCRALHAYTRNEELWRALFIESPPDGFYWQGTWRSTYLSQSKAFEPSVDCSNLFSDALHRPFFCANVNLKTFVSNIPHQNQIERITDIGYDEFASKWVNRPFILTEPVKRWPVYSSWSTSHLLEKYVDVPFRAETVDWPLQTYVDYMNNSNDESPLYLFDRSFVEKMEIVVTQEPSVGAAYWPPTCFGPDSFSVLDSQRPDHRWLIVGPERSGSTFHKDPNATSAWNAVLKGSKYWIMFPSSPNLPSPPGVYVSEDQSEVTSPLSIAEWLLGFHEQARKTPGCLEGICNEGEVLYVPSGWYHLVLNVEPSIALTQNFVPRARIGAVLQFLRDQKQSITGFSSDVENPYQLFVDRLEAQDPLALKEGLRQLDALDSSRKSKWEELTKADEKTTEEGFSFGFGGDDDDDAEVE